MGEIHMHYEDRVAILTIDNPPSNCITTKMFRQLGEQLQVISDRTNVCAGSERAGIR
jgi:enoyl-CoA hydratase/carnithine racemase